MQPYPDGGGAPPPDDLGNPPLPHLWHIVHLISHCASELLDNSRLSVEATPENQAAYELNRVSLRAWLAHLLRVVRTPVHATSQPFDLADVRDAFNELCGVVGNSAGDNQSIYRVKKQLLQILRKGGKA